MTLRPFSRYQHLLWIVTLVLVASGTLLLAACGDTSSSNTGTSTPTAQQASTPTQQAATPTPTAASTGNTSQVSIIANNDGTYAFSPASITIAKGTTVTWTNMTAAPHTVTSDSNAFGSNGSFTQNQTYQMTFTTAGTFTYHCNIHPYMKGTITVTA